VPGDLVSITIYLTDILDYQAHGREIRRSRRLGASWPTRSIRLWRGICRTALWQPEAMIEILGVAVIPDERLVAPES
jgi:hypothetical protein